MINYIVSLDGYTVNVLITPNAPSADNGIKFSIIQFPFTSNVGKILCNRAIATYLGFSLFETLYFCQTV